MRAKKNSIAILREQSGLTQVELAKQVDVSENTIANWEKGKASKWIHNLNKLCKVLGCTLEDLDSEIEHEDTMEPDLTKQIKEKVASYCLAVSKKDRKEAARIASFATLYDPQLKFWLNQARLTIEQLEKNQPKKVDNDLILNSLVLQNISIKLSRIPPNQVEIEQFSELAKEIKLSYEFLQKYIRFDPNNFSRKLIFQTKYLCLYVIGWKPGQESSMHHHGNSLDAIWVIDGEMTHWLHQGDEKNYPHESALRNFGEMYEGEEGVKKIEQGNWVFVDREKCHQIKNLSNKNLATLNFRFGSPPDDDKWNIDITEELPLVINKLIEKSQMVSS